MKESAILLVTCCLEQSRYDVLQQVVENLRTQCPAGWMTRITVFDNASTHPGVDELLQGFGNVHRADRNVGYWSAIDWWLNAQREDPPELTYIIESDMVHFAAERLTSCEAFLHDHPNIGAVRLHEYSVENKRLYDKDVPVQGSRRNLWQSHTNHVTGQPIFHEHVEGPFWRNNFLTQLPALNRYRSMVGSFAELNRLGSFSERDFQRAYHAEHPFNSIIDGGIFNCDLNPYGTKVVTGSWTLPDVLRSMGYTGTRVAEIVPRDQYTVRKVK